MCVCTLCCLAESNIWRLMFIGKRGMLYDTRGIWSVVIWRIGGLRPSVLGQDRSETKRNRSWSWSSWSFCFECWNIRSQDYSFPGTFVRWTVRSLEHSLPGPFIPWNFRSRDRTFVGPLVPWTIRSGDRILRGKFIPLTTTYRSNTSFIVYVKWWSLKQKY